MWNAVGEALKIFLEKHLIPTTISIVSAIDHIIGKGDVGFNLSVFFSDNATKIFTM